MTEGSAAACVIGQSGCWQQLAGCAGLQSCLCVYLLPVTIMATSSIDHRLILPHSFCFLTLPLPVSPPTSNRQPNDHVENLELGGGAEVSSCWEPGTVLRGRRSITKFSNMTAF